MKFNFFSRAKKAFPYEPEPISFIKSKSFISKDFWAGFILIFIELSSFYDIFSDDCI